MAKIVKVIDGYPGIGKSSWAIQEINNSSNQKFLYIVPLLDEVDRIADACPNKDFYKPDPTYGGGTKMNNLINLVNNGHNIVTTHQLIDRTEKELIDALRGQNYTLFIDEAQQVIHKFDYVDRATIPDEDYQTATSRIQNDFRTLQLKKFIKIVDKDGKVEWIEKLTLSPFDDIRHECDKGHMYSVDNSLFVWTFPVELFQENLFTEVYLMTFRFETLLQSKFFQYFSIPYKLYHIKNENNQYELTDREDEYDIDNWKTQVKKLLTIHPNERMNEIGENRRRTPINDNTLSLSWYNRSNSRQKTTLQRDLTNFYQNVTQSHVPDFVWTTFGDYKDHLTGNIVSESTFIALNTRATNDKRKCKSVAYLVNRFLDPTIPHFFRQKDIEINQEEWALSEFLQWIWRSRIREFKNITLYIPSRRMRTLLSNYFGIEVNETIQELDDDQIEESDETEHRILPRRKSK